MKTKIKPMIILALMLSISHSAWATDPKHYRDLDPWYGCEKEYFTLLKEKTELLGLCQKESDLNLTWKHQNYPLLRDNPRRVRYWQGGYSQDILVHETYLRELVDVCRAVVISSQEIIDTTRESVYFDVENLNLSRDIGEAYMLAPLTQKEAEQEMKAAELQCKSYKVR